MSCGIKRIIQFKEAVVYQSVQIYDVAGKDITEECEFSWSTDMVCWTGWCDWKSYNRICKYLESDFYLRIRINDTLGNVLLGGITNCCYTICVDNSNIFLQDFCNETIFSPYNNLDCAIQLQQQLSDTVVCMLGIPIYYFKVNPDHDSKDYTFKEYVLYNVQDVKQIKLIIPDNTMPSSNPKLSEFDFEWQTDWETEISKTHFAQAFGDHAIPAARDFIYIPMMKRMWEVNSAYDEKNGGLMWTSNTWKLQLVKYNEKTNVDFGDFEDIIDNLVSNKYEEVFGEYERNEQERLSGTMQIDSPKFAATNLYNIFIEDAVRKQYTKNDINILEKGYNHGPTVITRNIYRFKNNNGCITYQKPICGDEGTLMFIIETPGYLDESVVKDILNFGELSVDLTYSHESFELDFNGLRGKLEPFTSYMVILKWSKKNFITEMNIYKYIYPNNIPVYKVRPDMYKFDFENPIHVIGAYNNDLDMISGQNCQIHPYPLMMTNIKLYNKMLDEKEMIKESIKYTTTHEACMINDLARPLDNGHGYAVR